MQNPRRDLNPEFRTAAVLQVATSRCRGKPLLPFLQLLQLEPQKVRLWTADSARVVPILLIKCAATFIKGLYNGLALGLVVVVLS